MVLEILKVFVLGILGGIIGIIILSFILNLISDLIKRVEADIDLKKAQTEMCIQITIWMKGLNKYEGNISKNPIMQMNRKGKVDHGRTENTDSD